MGSITQKVWAAVKAWWKRELRAYLYEVYEAELAELATNHRRQLEHAGEQVAIAKKERRELEARCYQLASWMNHSGTGTVCLGRIDRMNEYGDIDPEFTIAVVQNTNEFKFVRDMLKDGPEGHATSTHGVHPAKRWGIKDWGDRDE